MNLRGMVVPGSSLPPKEGLPASELGNCSFHRGGGVVGVGWVMKTSGRLPLPSSTLPPRDATENLSTQTRSPLHACVILSPLLCPQDESWEAL